MFSFRFHVARVEPAVGQGTGCNTWKDHKQPFFFEIPTLVATFLSS